MIYAQIKNGLVENTIIVDNQNDLSLFSSDPLTQEPYDDIIRLDYLYPRPGIGWTFDGIQFNAPAKPAEPEE